MPRTRWRRRRVLIARLQLRLLSLNILYLSAVMFVFLAAIFSPVIVDLYSDGPPEKLVRAADEFLGLHSRVWPAVPIALLLISFHSVVISHRIAGPLYRFRAVFRSVQQGDFTAYAGIRRRDYLQAEAAALREMIGGLGQRISSVKVAARELTARLPDPEQAMGTERKQALQELHARADLLLRELGAFRLAGQEEPDVQPGCRDSDSKHSLVDVG
jgi:methyl-accepting chemotaxis protein